MLNVFDKNGETHSLLDIKVINEYIKFQGQTLNFDEIKGCLFFEILIMTTGNQFFNLKLLSSVPNFQVISGISVQYIPNIGLTLNDNADATIVAIVFYT